MLDGYGRSIVHWEIREAMAEQMSSPSANAQRSVSRAIALALLATTPEFIARDFKEFGRILNMTHVRISPDSPSRTASSSAGTRRSKGHRARAIADLARRSAQTRGSLVEHHNRVRLRSALG